MGTPAISAGTARGSDGARRCRRGEVTLRAGTARRAHDGQTRGPWCQGGSWRQQLDRHLGLHSWAGSAGSRALLQTASQPHAVEGDSDQGLLTSLRFHLICAVGVVAAGSQADRPCGRGEESRRRPYSRPSQAPRPSQAAKPSQTAHPSRAAYP